MTAYAAHTTFSIGVGPTGHTHTRAQGDDGTPFAVDCPACEPYLIREGWVANIALVPLTDRQIAERDRVTREGNDAVKLAAERIAANTVRQVMRPDDDPDMAARMAVAANRAARPARPPRPSRAKSA